MRIALYTRSSSRKDAERKMEALRYDATQRYRGQEVELVEFTDVGRATHEGHPARARLLAQVQHGAFDVVMAQTTYDLVADNMSILPLLHVALRCGDLTALYDGSGWVQDITGLEAAERHFDGDPAEVVAAWLLLRERCISSIFTAIKELDNAVITDLNTGRPPRPHPTCGHCQTYVLCL